MHSLDTDNPKLTLERQLKALEDLTSHQVLYPKNRRIKAAHIAALDKLGNDLPGAVSVMLLATQLKSRASGFVQGGFFGICLGFVALGLGSLAQFWQRPNFAYGFVAGALLGLAIAQVVHKQMKGK